MMSRNWFCWALAFATSACAASPSTPSASTPSTPSTPSTSSSEPPAAAAPPAAPGADVSVQAAAQAAQAWLALVDREKYAESWNSAAELFRRNVSVESWANAAASVRAPLGKLISRTLRSADAKTSAPGAPDGKYVVIQFDTTFENKAQGVETVTPMQEKDGTWKVAGYFVR